MNVKYWLIVSALMALSFIAVGMVFALNNTSGRADKTAIFDAIYIQHIGESDKPIHPLVVGVTAPPEDELKLVLGNHQWKHATIIIIPDSLFGNLAARVGGALGKIEKDAEGRAYGTFKITIAGPEGEVTRTLDAAATKAILDIVIDVSDRTSGELADAILNLKRRLP
jgi:hypothetical protein